MEGLVNRIDGREDGRNEQAVGKLLFHLEYRVIDVRSCLVRTVVYF